MNWDRGLKRLFIILCVCNVVVVTIFIIDETEYELSRYFSSQSEKEDYFYSQYYSSARIGNERLRYNTLEEAQDFLENQDRDISTINITLFESDIASSNRLRELKAFPGDRVEERRLVKLTDNEVQDEINIEARDNYYRYRDENIARYTLNLKVISWFTLISLICYLAIPLIVFALYRVTKWVLIGFKGT